MTKQLNPYSLPFTKRNNLILNSCTKAVFYDESIGDPLKTDFISVIPSNLSDSIIVDPILSVTFKEGTDPQVISSSTISLKLGAVAVPGAVSFSGTTTQFTASSDLNAESEYEATITTTSSSEKYSNKEYSWRFKTGRHHSYNSLTVVSVIPFSNATGVPVDSTLTVTFNKELTSTMSAVTSVTLKKGTTTVGGTLSFSGNTARFKPAAPLSPKTIYNGYVQIGPVIAGTDPNVNNFMWNFTTAGAAADITAPVVSSAVPANNATSVSISVNPTVTFSETMNPATLTSSTFTLKQGTSTVAGSVSVTGTTSTFTPASPLTADKVYTGTVTTSVKDAAGKALASNYSWSFTTAATADITAPTVLSVVPANNGTGIAANIKTTATFSEAMNAATITSSTFTLKQGTTNVAGSVTYSGTTATFTPSAALSGNTLYTATLTTGAKDASGNALATSYTWSFTTVAGATGKSFATDVMPILGICNTCHTHNWTTSATASTFYTNLVSGGYVNAATPADSKIYKKLNGGHPGSTVTTAQVNTILTWMTEGSKNN